MLDVLVASRPGRQAGAAELVAASMMHIFVLAICVVGTRATVRAVTRPVADTTMVFLPRLAPPVVDRTLTRPGAGGGSGDGSGLAVVISANPPPRGFLTVEAVGSVPTTIPTVDLGARAIDPRDFTGRGVEGGVGWGVVGGTGDPTQPPPDEGLREMLYTAATPDARFIPAELIVRPVFVYPRVLLESGIAGRVVLQFVIDTSGLVEPGSIVVLETSHPAFAEAARVGVVDAQFHPATFGGRNVRQLSKWPVSFALAEK